MQKSKLGISVGLLGAAIYFSGLFSGLLLIAILAGYVLLVEENVWLRRTAVKAVALFVMFSLMSTLVSLIPDVIDFISSFCGVFGGSLSIPVISSIIDFILKGIEIVKVVFFIVLGLKSLNQGTIVTPLVDKLINKYMQ